MIEVRDLKKSFGSHPILAGVNLRIETGESVVIIGRSGGGKSVLIKHLIGLLKPDAGEVLIDGENIVPMNERELIRVRSKFGMLFQGAALFDSMTVAENVGFAFRRRHEMPESEIREKVEAALDVVDLPGTGEKKPSELSGGMRKRVGLARAIAIEPRYMLYDEPTTGLDPVTSAVIDRLMVKTREALGVTSIVITHDMRSAYTVGDRIAMLYEGRLRAVGTVDEIRNSDDPVVRGFIEGDPDLRPLSGGPFSAAEELEVEGSPG
jgi:phospholipid/cholesterol/gamma-HCH transport system ATP-binding protein